MFRVKGRKPKGIDIDVKRFYMEGVKLIGECPHCGEPIEWDFGSNYLSYPAVNRPFTDYVVCYECDTEIPVKLELGLYVRTAKED